MRNFIKLVYLTCYSWNSTWCFLVAVVTFLLQILSKTLFLKTDLDIQRNTRTDIFQKICVQHEVISLLKICIVYKTIVWLLSKWNAFTFFFVSDPFLF